MNTLTTTQCASMLDDIEALGTVQEAIAYIKQMTALRTVLESVGQFRDKAVMYARLEVSALLRVCELGGVNELKGDLKKTAEWLFTMDETERDRYIEMCGEGVTIDYLYKREVKDPLKFQKKVRDLSDRRDWVVDDLKEKGIVSIEDFVQEATRSLPDDRSLVRDMVDGLRHRLREAGGVGVGEKGVYVLPTAENKTDVEQAILLRVKSILADFQNIQEIASAANVTMPYTAFLEDGKFPKIRTYNAYIPHVLLTLERLNVISDSEDMYEAIERDDVRKEIDSAAAFMHTARDKVVESMYKNIHERSAANG